MSNSNAVCEIRERVNTDMELSMSQEGMNRSFISISTPSLQMVMGQMKLIHWDLQADKRSKSAEQIYGDVTHFLCQTPHESLLKKSSKFSPEGLYGDIHIPKTRLVEVKETIKCAFAQIPTKDVDLKFSVAALKSS